MIINGIKQLPGATAKAEMTNEARAEVKLVFTMPCEEEFDVRQ